MRRSLSVDRLDGVAQHHDRTDLRRPWLKLDTVLQAAEQSLIFDHEIHRDNRPRTKPARGWRNAAIPGCVSQGETKPEALKNVREAIELCLEVRAERGLPLTIETKQVEGRSLMRRCSNERQGRCQSLRAGTAGRSPVRRAAT